MTQSILPADSLKDLDPALVSPALPLLAGDDAPTRAIVCAGGGHFASASVTLSQGRQVGDGAEAGERVIEQWQAISNRTGELVPARGFLQVEREVASASASR